MGKPSKVYTLESYGESNNHSEGKPVNWNILVTGRKENNNDSQSSGERNGIEHKPAMRDSLWAVYKRSGGTYLK